MKQAIGGATIINIVIVFIVIIFALLAATFSYAKAYKVNTKIMNGIEIYEGYNNGSVKYANRFLQGLGYTKGAKKDCPSTKNINGKSGSLVENQNNDYYYCVYYYSAHEDGNCYYSYAVVTYITFDLPFVGRFDLPITSKTNRIYNFDRFGGSDC